jgi:hypothetical protein
MKGAAPEAGTGGKPSSLLSKELRRIAPQVRLHGISVVFERNRDRRFITITRYNRPETVLSHVSGNRTKRSVNIDRRTKFTVPRNSFASKAMALWTVNRGFSHKLCVARSHPLMCNPAERPPTARQKCATVSNREQP